MQATIFTCKVFVATAINILSEGKKEYRQVYSLSNAFLGIIGIFIVIGTIKIGVNDWDELNKVDAKIKRRHKIEILKTCGLSVKKLPAFLYECVPKMFRRMDEKEFKSIIDGFKDSN